MYNLRNLNFWQRSNCKRYQKYRSAKIYFRNSTFIVFCLQVDIMAKFYSYVVFMFIWSEFVMSSILADESRCNVSVYKTTQDLVYYHPVVVNISIEVASLQVDTGDMDFSLEFFFRQGWNDPNLAYEEKQAGGKKFIVFKVDLVKDLWTPDTYIYGIRSIQTVQTDSAVPASEGLRISPNGDVLFSTRLSMTVSCSMTFHDFPMDKQTCFLNITSFFYTDEDLHYEWGELTVLNKHIAHFVLVSFEKKKTVQEFTSGKYGLLSVAFEFKRRINFYLLSWYLPATLIVALSWVGFWIDTKSTPARISLGTITILAMGSFLIGEQEGFPSVSYVRAIDIYLITCFVFVFGCMVEYPFVHYAKRLAEKMQADKKDDPEMEDSYHFNHHNQNKAMANGVVNGGFMESFAPTNSHDILQWTNLHISSSEPPVETRPKEQKPSVRQPQRTRNKMRFIICWAAKLDEICRLAFPLSFIMLSIAYWVVFLILNSHE
ncbi:hypothetical protein pdam_00001553 [Pocillopora damicornis]|uniref:Neurotransmitter-gated ion-channel ligand-binding domain-containing protein n=1 Tax=Pocillopora damicornis TaxID=46731 RepID=A0A3M6U4U4_POCDA|nr:hypothetical protein pdam_00001553 [Pocillopora damicornis]